MKTLKSYIILAACINFLSGGAAAQELVYQIISNGTVIGQAFISKTENAGLTTYSFHSLAKTRVLIEINVDQDLESSYENGQLVSSSLKRKINSTLKVNNHIVRDGDGYLLTDKDGSQHHLSEVITSGMASLYFCEPLNDERILSEGFLRMLQATRIAESTCKILLPDGHSNFYTYSGGICVRAEFQTSWSTVIMQLVSNDVIKSSQANSFAQSEKN